MFPAVPVVSVEAVVILCTYNRAADLRLTLERFCNLEIPRDLRWELLVIDNNSKDATKDVCDEFGSQLPLRYLVERHQGLSCARNRGLREARAPLLVFTDDDVDVDPVWLAALWSAVQKHPEAGFFGGPIVPKWEVPPPRWIVQYGQTLLPQGISMYYDLGPVEKLLDQGDLLFFGANMAFRKSVFRSTGFREDLGLCGKSPIQGEETDLMRQLVAAGHRGLYVPAAVVHHRNSRRRATEHFLRAWVKGYTIAEARRQGLPEGRHFWFGAPRFYWRLWLQQTLRYVWTRLTRPAEVWLRAEIAMATTWGYLCEFRRQTARR